MADDFLSPVFKGVNGGDFKVLFEFLEYRFYPYHRWTDLIVETNRRERVCLPILLLELLSIVFTLLLPRALLLKLLLLGIPIAFVNGICEVLDGRTALLLLDIVIFDKEVCDGVNICVVLAGRSFSSFLQQVLLLLFPHELIATSFFLLLAQLCKHFLLHTKFFVSDLLGWATSELLPLVAVFTLALAFHCTTAICFLFNGCRPCCGRLIPVPWGALPVRQFSCISLVNTAFVFPSVPSALLLPPSFHALLFGARLPIESSFLPLQEQVDWVSMTVASGFEHSS